tara:strand:+ start:79 stop:378 length:300 start_codon:yes stop_codon:yes gene_type:complete
MVNHSPAGRTELACDKENTNSFLPVLEVIESFGGVLPDWSSTSGGTVIAASVLKRQPLAGKIAVVLVMVKLVEAGVSRVGVNLKCNWSRVCGCGGIGDS